MASEATLRMASEEPVGVMFCLECMYKHSRDLEHHMEDAVRVSRGKQREFFENWIDEIRKLRKQVLGMMIRNATPSIASDEEPEESSTSCGCQGIVEPGDNPNEELAEAEASCTWRKEEVKPKEYFDPESFRTLCPKCAEQRCALCTPEQACSTRVIIGCKAGEFISDASGTSRCGIGTEPHVIYHAT